MTVAGGFGGSGDDQSGLVQRGEGEWGHQSQREAEAEKLGHFASSLIRVAVSVLLMQ